MVIENRKENKKCLERKKRREKSKTSILFRKDKNAGDGEDY